MVGAIVAQVFTLGNSPAALIVLFVRTGMIAYSRKLYTSPAKGAKYDHFCNRRQHASGPVFREAGAVDSSASQETRRNRSPVARPSRLSDAFLRSGSAACDARPRALRE